MMSLKPRAGRLPHSLAVPLLLPLGLAGCLSTAPQPQPVSVPVPARAAPAGPAIAIAASSERVRQVVASRARARGTAVARNTAQGVVLERQLAQTPPVLEESCGPHREGRLVRVVLSTFPDATGTRLVEERFVVDGGDICPVQLTEADVEEANRNLADIKAEAERTAQRR